MTRCNAGRFTAHTSDGTTTTSILSVRPVKNERGANDESRTSAGSRSRSPRGPRSARSRSREIECGSEYEGRSAPVIPTIASGK